MNEDGLEGGGEMFVVASTAGLARVFAHEYYCVRFRNIVPTKYTLHFSQYCL